MTIQSSGEISLSDIQAEFGGVSPIELSEYYGNGILVPTDLGIPSSGLLALSDFRGKTNYTSKTISQSNISVGTGSIVGSGWTPNSNGYGPYPSRSLDSLNWTTTIKITSLTVYMNAFIDYGFNLFIGVNNVWNTTSICSIFHGNGGSGYASGTFTIPYSIEAGSIVKFAFSTGPYWQQVLSNGTVTVTFNK